MENKEMSLTEFMKMYRDEKHKMVSISQSINAKERKIKVLKEEYYKLAVEAQKFGWKKITVDFEKFRMALQKHFKTKGVAIDIEWPRIEAPKEGELSKESILYSMKAKNKDWIKVTAYTRYDCEEEFYPIVLSAPQVDGKNFQEHIKIKKVEKGEKKYYQLYADENILNFTFKFDDCVVFERGTLMFAKNIKGAVLKMLIENEKLQTQEKAGEIE